jgi:hypothetical protein
MLSALAIIALAFVLLLRPPPSSWVGEARLRVHIKLVESATGRALPNTVVMMSHPGRGRFTSDSDVDGMAEFVIPCGLVGTNFATHTKASVDCRSWQIGVTLPGELSVNRELAAYTGEFVDFAGTDATGVTIRFKVEPLEPR